MTKALRETQTLHAHWL